MSSWNSIRCWKRRARFCTWWLAGAGWRWRRYDNNNSPGTPEENPESADAGALFTLEAYLGQLAWPDFTSYPKTETAFLDVAKRVGGNQPMLLVSVALVVAGVASAVTGQTSASRLLYGMGRDRLSPPRIFAYIHPSYSTPTYGVLCMGVVTLICGFLLSFQRAAEAINFGALLGFMCANLSVISRFYIRDRARKGWDVVGDLLLPGTGFAVCLFIFVNLSRTASVIGAVWALTGLIYIAVRTGWFGADSPVPAFSGLAGDTPQLG